MKKMNRGFSLIELLIVIAIIMIIAAVAVPNLLQSRMAANQASAVENCRDITSAEVTYATIYGVGFASSLTALGPSAGGGPASALSADLLSSPLASGTEGGYHFGYTAASADPLGHFQAFTLSANPQVPGVSGKDSYFVDQTFVIRFSASGAASASSTPLN